MIVSKRYLRGVVIYPTNVSVVSANGQKFECTVQDTLNLVLNKLRREFTWTFVIADITKPLLGYDFLNHFGLIIDCYNNRLIDTITNRLSNATPTPEIINLTVNQDNSTTQLYEKLWKNTQT